MFETNPFIQAPDTVKIKLVVALFSSVVTFTTTSHAQTVGADEAAIHKTLDGILLAADKRDLNAFTDLFVNSPDLYYQISTPDKHEIVAYGFDNMKKMIDGYMKSLPALKPGDPLPSSAKVFNYHVRVKGSLAFVSDGIDYGKEQSQNFMILEKTAGQWKILALMGQHYEMGNLIEVK